MRRSLDPVNENILRIRIQRQLGWQPQNVQQTRSVSVFGRRRDVCRLCDAPQSTLPGLEMDDAIREAKSFHSVQLAQEECKKNAAAGAKEGGKARKQLYLQKFLTHGE